MFKYLYLYFYKKRNRHVRDLISASDDLGERINREMNFLNAAKHNTSFPCFLSVCAIIKDEGRYLQEWIEYHKLMGVEKFYLYDNESTDNTKLILKPYIESGIVEYVYWAGVKQQLYAYNDCIRKHKNDTSWMAFIDLDEFICNPTGKEKNNIVSYLKSLPYHYTQVFLKWVVFGSGGHKKYAPGLVIERFKYRAKKHIHGEKSIVNPRAVVRIEVHRHDVYGLTATPTEKKLRINHYQVKSYEEFLTRQSRGDVFFGNDANNLNKYQRDFFEKNDLNEVYDDSLDETICILKTKCKS